MKSTTIYFHSLKSNYFHNSLSNIKIIRAGNKYTDSESDIKFCLTQSARLKQKNLHLTKTLHMRSTITN